MVQPLQDKDTDGKPRLQAFPEVLTVFGRQFFRPVALGAELAHEEAQNGRFLHEFQAADQIAVVEIGRASCRERVLPRV